MEWKRMEADRTWRLFLESLWTYQYTRKNTPLSQELADALYFETQGIADFAIKLYLLAQRRAITIGTEEITVELIHSVGQDALAPASQVLSGLRNHAESALRDLPDIRPVDVGRFIAETQAKANAKAIDNRRPSQPTNTPTANVPAGTSTSSSLVPSPVPTQAKRRQTKKKQEFSVDGFGCHADEFLS